MILPYVYKLTHRETNEFYIGFRKSNKIKSEYDLGFKYFSSSKQVKKLGFENFNIEIIAEFFKWEDAYLFEQELIKENFSNKLILNKNYHYDGKNNFKIFDQSGEKSPSFGRKLSEETKFKLSKFNKGKKLSDETKLKISKSLKGRCRSIEYRKNISESKKGEKNPMFGRRGKKHSEETKLKISESHKIFSFIEEFEIYILYIGGFKVTEIYKLLSISNISIIYASIKRMKNIICTKENY